MKYHLNQRDIDSYLCMIYIHFYSLDMSVVLEAHRNYVNMISLVSCHNISFPRWMSTLCFPTVFTKGDNFVIFPHLLSGTTKLFFRMGSTVKNKKKIKSCTVL